MAIGDDALDSGFVLVPDTGEEGRVRWGAREINRTRDYIAVGLRGIPVGRKAFRDAAGVTSGTVDPGATYGLNGDIYFKTL